MKRGWWSVLVVLLVVVLASGTPALARKSGSSFSSGGKSRSSGWGSSTRSSGWGNSSTTPRSSGWGSTPTAPTAPKNSGWGNTPSTPPSSSGWGNSSRPTSPSAPSPGRDAVRPSGGWGNTGGASAPSARSESARPGSSFATSGQSAIQKETSRKAYNDYQGRFAKPENPVPPSAQTGPIPTSNRTWDNYRDYRTNRDTYYAGRGWSPPGYAYRSFPSFGIWDAMFLWFMLRQASGPSFMYNHQNDPGVKTFRQEADKLAENDADLKKQLADLDAKVEQMRRDGVPVDPKALPPGVDPAVALAADKVVQEKPDSGGGFGTWLVIFGVGAGVAVLFLATIGRRRNVG